MFNIMRVYLTSKIYKVITLKNSIIINKYLY